MNPQVYKTQLRTAPETRNMDLREYVTYVEHRAAREAMRAEELRDQRDQARGLVAVILLAVLLIGIARIGARR